MNDGREGIACFCEAPDRVPKKGSAILDKLRKSDDLPEVKRALINELSSTYRAII